MEQHQIDRTSFTTGLLVIFLVCLPLAMFPDSGGKALLEVYDFIASQLGFLYLLAGCSVLVLLGWLALGHYGRVVLGPAGDRPEFSDISWAAMLFCAGVGAGLMFWAPVEWAYYYDAPPFGVAPRSAAAAAWASTYGLFHWGPTAWAFYCLPTLAIAYPYYVKRVPQLRFSNSCHYFLGNNRDSAWARAIDVLFMIALLGGTGSSLGFSTPMIAACIARLLGMEPSFPLEVFSVLLCVALFATSVWLGLRKGILRLSNINLILAFALLAFVLVAGPTIFLFKTSVNGVGMVVQNFVRMNSWTAPFTETDFIKDWTVFYWAWWIAYGPFVGLFVTRISKGRSIRQVILGMIGYGSLGGGLFYMILGNYGLHLQLNGTAITEVLKDAGQSAAILAILEELPWATLPIGVFFLVSLAFTATTYDSASYTLASCATKRLEAGDEPARWHRLFWALTLAVLPLTLMAIGRRLEDPRSALRVVQTATLAVSLPILLVGVLMSVALVKQLRCDFESDQEL